uniref:Uncharacterized protein n=1 Tax=Parascaris equorum TaxID=6256 RepID=A0A914RYP5_PAREQ
MCGLELFPHCQLFIHLALGFIFVLRRCLKTC